jgi:prevent-host-death family protein
MATAKARRKEQGAVTLSVSDAADRLGELVVRVAEGETVVITRYNKPAARLVPIDDAA